MRRNGPYLVAVLAVLGLVAIGHAQAPTRRPMTLVDIAELKRVNDPQISPDGRFVTYMLSHADWRANRPVWQLWRQATAGGAPVQLTSAPNGDIPGTTRWSPDGRSIAFGRDGQIMLVAADGGEP